MNKITVGQVNAYVGNADTVNAEEDQVALGSIIIILYSFATFSLLPCGADKAGAINLIIQFLGEGRAVNAGRIIATVFIVCTVPPINETV